MENTVTQSKAAGILLLFLIIALSQANLLAQEQQTGSQFLFALDTSSSMSRLSRNAFDCISNLVSSGVQGQIKPGDPLRVWTFNDSISTNRFGPINWDPPLNLAITKSVLNHLKSKKFEKRTRFDPLWAALKDMAQEAGSLTVVIVTDGDDTVNGTAFDKALNEVFQNYGKELRRMRKPFVVTMQARQGQFLACNVCAAGVAIPFDELARQIANAMPSPKIKEPEISAPAAAPPPEIKPNLVSANATNTPPVTVPQKQIAEPSTPAPPKVESNTTIPVLANTAPTTNAMDVKPINDTNPPPSATTVAITEASIPTNAPASNKIETVAEPAPALTAPTQASKTNAAPLQSTSPHIAVTTTNAITPATSITNPVKTNKSVSLQTNAPPRARTNSVSGFKPETQIIGSSAVDLVKTNPTPTAKAKTPASPTKSKGNNLNYWIIGSMVFAALIAIVLLAMKQVRQRRVVNQSSFISRGIERHLR